MDTKEFEKMPYGIFNPDTEVYIAKHKATGKEFEVVRYGTMGLYDKHHNYVDFYDVDIVRRKK